jgi:hypothetical protein
MRVDREAMIGGGRVDFLITLRVGVEVKNVEELASTSEIIAQVSKYLANMEALILFINSSRLGDAAIDRVRKLCTELPSGTAVVYGNIYNPLTWRAVCDASLLDVVRRVML